MSTDPRPCAFQHRSSPSHSEDRVEIFHGRPEPVLLCGYHATPEWLPDALAYVAERRKEAADG